jgi:hypothetical protein
MHAIVDEWFHTIAQWSLTDWFLILNGLCAVGYMLVMSRYYWSTRRRPQWKAKPIDIMWKQPKGL